MIYNYNDALKMLNEMRYRIEIELEKQTNNLQCISPKKLNGINVMAKVITSLIDDNINKIHKELKMMKRVL